MIYMLKKTVARNFILDGATKRIGHFPAALNTASKFN